MEFCEDVGIKLGYTTRRHLQADDLAEVNDQTNTAILKRKVDENPGIWADIILEVLRAYHTLAKMSTGIPLFTLVFEIVIDMPVGLV